MRLLPAWARGDRRRDELEDEVTRLRGILQDSPSGIVVIDADSRVVEWSRQCERLFIWTRAEAVGADLGSLIIPERYRGAHARGVRAYMRTGRSNLIGKASLALTAIRKDGVEISVRLSLALCRSRPPHFVGFVQDASHLDRLQADLAEVHRLKRTADALIANLDGAVAVLNADLRVVFCNAEFDAFQGDRSMTEIAAELDIGDALTTQGKGTRYVTTTLVHRTRTVYNVRVHGLSIEGQAHVMLMVREEASC